MSPRWRKLVGDAQASSGRLLAIAGAMSLSIAAVTALLVADRVLTRELPRNYLGSHPASAILTLDQVDDELVQAVRTRPGIVAAEAGATLSAKIEIKANEWLPLALRIVPAPANSKIDTVTSHSGAWPPPSGTILLERTARNLMGRLEGRTAEIEMPGGVRKSVPIAGLVHDAGQPPSEQEQTIYGYVSPETSRGWAADSRLNVLKIIVADESNDMPAIEAIARSLALWLRDNGRDVVRVSIPPPGKHPHQWQYDTILKLLLGFAVCGLLFEAILMTIVVTGMLAPQVRQIAVMKAIGARSTQIMALYLSLVGAIAAVAIAVGLPLGLYAGRGLVNKVAGILNLEIASYVISWEVVSATAAFALALPVVAALVPIRSAVRRTVRESLDDYGVVNRSIGLRAVDGVLALFRKPNPLVHLAIRTTMRRAGRLTLTLCLLAIAGAIFMVGGNLLAVWNGIASRAIAERRYDIQLVLRRAEDRNDVLARIRSVDGVRVAETADAMSALADSGDHLVIASTGKNSLALQFALPDSRLRSVTLREGRWLRPEDTDAIVLSTSARDAVFPNSKVGDGVDLLVNRRSVRLKIVGIVQGFLESPTAYTTSNIYDDVADTPGSTRLIRIALAPGYSVKTVSAATTRMLERAGIGVRTIVTTETFTRSISGHVYIVMFLLGVIVIGVATIGALGLASALTAGIIERTREFGIMRALGARSYHVYGCVVSEALFVGFLGWGVSVLVSFPFTFAAMKLLRSIAQQESLPFAWSAAAPLAWLVIALTFALAASLYPARRAAGLRVGRALTYT